MLETREKETKAEQTAQTGLETKWRKRKIARFFYFLNKNNQLN
jgi:hypothetical protein